MAKAWPRDFVVYDDPGSVPANLPGQLNRIGIGAYGPGGPDYEIKFTADVSDFQWKLDRSIDQLRPYIKPKFKFTDNRRWERPYSYPIEMYRIDWPPWHGLELDLADYVAYPGPWLHGYWYFEFWAEELSHDYWLNDVKTRLGLVTSERGCVGIRPKPQLGAAWDALVEKWGS